MKTRFLSFCLILLVAGLTFSQTQRFSGSPFLHRLKGTVKDQNGAVYSGITLYFNREEKSDAIPANINGEFGADLLAGKYTVTVNKTNPEGFIAHISIEENGLNPNNVEFIVDSSAAVCADQAAKTCPGILKSVKPAYPPAARAIRASGEVVVAVRVDKDGKVLSAWAETGNPLLRSASVTAARGFIFDATDSTDPRELRLTFVFLGNEKENDGITRVSNAYRIEVIGPPVTVDI